MAIESVVIRKCPTCGKEFKSSKWFDNREEANSWEAWAKEYRCECPKCSENSRTPGPRYTYVRLSDPESEESAQNVYIMLYGDTYSIKDQLKAVGARWTNTRRDYAPIMGDKCWQIACKPDKQSMSDVAAKLAIFGFCAPEFDRERFMGIVEWFDSFDFELGSAAVSANAEAHAESEKRKAEEMEAKQAELGECPQWPEAFSALRPKGSKWNGKFYGKPGCWRVYFDGKEVAIPDSVKVDTELAYIARNAWYDKKRSLGL